MDFSKKITLELTVDEAIELLAETTMAITILHQNLEEVMDTSETARMFHNYFKHVKHLHTCKNLGEKLNKVHDDLRAEIDQIEQEINNDRPKSTTDILEQLLRDNGIAFTKIDPGTN